MEKNKNKYKNNRPIMNIEKVTLSKNDFIYHAGTKLNNNKLFSNGGRVLNFVSIDENLEIARDDSINLIKRLDWKNGHHRNDIGYRVIGKK